MQFGKNRGQDVATNQLARKIGVQPIGRATAQSVANSPESKELKWFDKEARQASTIFTAPVVGYEKDQKALLKALGISESEVNHQNSFLFDRNAESEGPTTKQVLSDDAKKKLDQYTYKALKLGENIGQRIYYDKEGKEVYRGTPYMAMSDNDFNKEAAISIASTFLGAGIAAPAAAGIGSAMGLSGTAGTMVGNGVLNAGMALASGAEGSDILKAGAVGAVGSGIGSYGASAGWNPQVTGFAAKTVPSILAGNDPQQVLLNAAIGQGTQAVAPNPAIGNLLGNIIKTRVNRP